MVLQEIKNRYSVRKFTDQMPSDEIINKILEAGRLAPSWVNVQPWHFIVIKDSNTKELLSKLSLGQQHVAQAPVVIACCGDLSAWDVDNYRKIIASRPGISEERINNLLSDPGFNHKLRGNDIVLARTLEQVTYPIAYMTLAAEEFGLGACVIGRIGNEYTGSVPEIYAEARKTLELPDYIVIAALLIVGYASPEAPKFTKMRKSEGEVISFEKYNHR